jgi:hypothetical protein
MTFLFAYPGPFMTRSRPLDPLVGCKVLVMLVMAAD